MFEVNVNKMAYTGKDQCPPTAFSVPKRNKKLGGVKEEKKEKEEEKKKRKISLLTHATARGMGKNVTEGREGKKGTSLGLGF